MKNTLLVFIDSPCQVLWESPSAWSKGFCDDINLNSEICCFENLTNGGIIKDSKCGDFVFLLKSGVLFTSSAALEETIRLAKMLSSSCPVCLFSSELRSPCGIFAKKAAVEEFIAAHPDINDETVFFMLFSSCYSCKGLNMSKKDIFIVRSPLEAMTASKAMTEKAIGSFLEKGVNFLSADGILIGREVEIAPNATILPGTILKGRTLIKSGAVIGHNSLLCDCTVGENSIFNASQGYSSVIENNVSIGPFCHIRPNSVIKSGAHLGDFVEIKNSTIGEATHVSHLTYVGDSDVGKRVNFGCGVVTVNYNGVSKARCSIGDDAFIGCNTNLVAPVTIGENGYTAAGSTITGDVPENALAIARARQVNKEDYNSKLRPRLK